MSLFHARFRTFFCVEWIVRGMQATLTHSTRIATKLNFNIRLPRMTQWRSLSVCQSLFLPWPEEITDLDQDSNPQSHIQMKRIHKCHGGRDETVSD